jgi:hypothetical protein
MKGLVAASVAVLLALVVIAAWGMYGTTTGFQCDGTIPTWMIEAQDYDGGGCAEVLSPWKAPPPPLADWTPYCLGMCTDLLP